MTKQKKPSALIDLSTLRIVDEPYQGRRPAQESKYEPFFSALKPNQRLVCPPGAGGKIANQLKKWLEKRGNKSPVVRSIDRCEDGNGGVWWIKEAEKPRTVWASLEKKAA